LKIAGVDPGFKGAIAFIEERNIKVFDLPIINGQKKSLNLIALKNLIIEENPEYLFVEQPQGRPGQGLSSTSRFFYWAGAIVGLCIGLDRRVVLITPQSWKKEFGLIGKEKRESIYKASLLFPEVEFKRTDDGKADALLIAFYGKKFLQSAKTS